MHIAILLLLLSSNGRQKKKDEKKGEIERLFGRSIESIIVHKKVSREEKEEQKIYIYK